LRARSLLDWPLPIKIKENRGAKGVRQKEKNSLRFDVEANKKRDWSPWATGRPSLIIKEASYVKTKLNEKRCKKNASKKKVGSADYPFRKEIPKPVTAKRGRDRGFPCR